jgi:bacterioferritin
MRLLSNYSLFPGIGSRLVQESDTLDSLGVVSDNVLMNLNDAMADEFLSMYQYFTQVRVLENSNVKPYIIKELKQHAIEEYKHAGMIADRIIALGGQIITNPSELYTYSGCGIIEPKNPDSLQIVKDAIQGENCAIDSYTKMANFAISINDIQTYDMFQSIIQDEMEHANDLNNLIFKYQLR